MALVVVMIEDKADGVRMKVAFDPPPVGDVARASADQLLAGELTPAQRVGVMVMKAMAETNRALVSVGPDDWIPF